MRPSIRLDFVLYAGDPDAGAEVVASEQARPDDERLGLNETPYGAIVFEKDGQRLADLKPNPIVPLVTKLLRTVQYVIEGEPETVLYSESEHGLLLERVSDEVQLSFFVGSDPEEPEALLIKELLVPLDDYAAQVVEMGERLIGLVGDEEDEDGLVQFLDLARTAHRAWRLERDRVRRR